MILSTVSSYKVQVSSTSLDMDLSTCPDCYLRIRSEKRTGAASSAEDRQLSSLAHTNSSHIPIRSSSRNSQWRQQSRPSMPKSGRTPCLITYARPVSILLSDDQPISPPIRPQHTQKTDIIQWRPLLTMISSSRLLGTCIQLWYSSCSRDGHSEGPRNVSLPLPGTACMPFLDVRTIPSGQETAR